MLIKEYQLKKKVIAQASRVVVLEKHTNLDTKKSLQNKYYVTLLNIIVN